MPQIVHSLGSYNPAIEKLNIMGVTRHEEDEANDNNNILFCLIM